MSINPKANSNARDAGLVVCINNGFSPRPLRLCGEILNGGHSKGCLQ
jgi:hypothetical protein